MLLCWNCVIHCVIRMILNKVWNVMLAVLLASVLWSCNDDTVSAGASALSPEDGIRVKSDTFSVSSALEASTAISLTPDSFLLGECDTHFGTIKADILAQFACPEGFEYPTQVSNPHTPVDAKFAPTDALEFITEEIPCDTNPLDQTWTYLYEAVANGKEYPIKSEEALMVMEVITEIKNQNEI